VYQKGKYSSYWKHLLYPLLSTEICIEQSFKQKTIDTGFLDEVMKRNNITHTHLTDIVQILGKMAYKNYRIEQFSASFIQLFIQHSAKENLQSYIDTLTKSTENMEIVTPLSEAIRHLQEMYNAV
jgi:hypothetical protein